MLLVIFLACAAVIWGAGVVLSDSTDVLSRRLHLGAHHTDIYLTALGGLLTVVYLVGLVFRPSRQWLRMGSDSIAVVVLYALGIAGLALVPS